MQDLRALLTSYDNKHQIWSFQFGVGTFEEDLMTEANNNLVRYLAPCWRSDAQGEL